MTTNPTKPAAKKLSMQQRYSALTRDIDWTPTYVTEEQLYPHNKYEGI